MAFAGTKSQDQTSPFVTEKDLFKQVASNVTKESLIIKKTKVFGGDEDSATALSVTSSKLNANSVTDAKRQMLQNLQRVQKVWFAFVKFLKN